MSSLHSANPELKGLSEADRSTVLPFNKLGDPNLRGPLYPRPAVIFDYANTITDDEPSMRAAWRRLLHDHGHAVLEDGFYYYGYDLLEFTRSFEDLPKRFQDKPAIKWQEKWEDPGTWYGSGNQFVYNDLKAQGYLLNVHSYEETEIFRNAIYKEAIARGALQFRPHMKAFISYLKEIGSPSAIASNDSRELCGLRSHAIGIGDEHNVMNAPFQFTATPEDVGGRTKPAPDLYLYAARRLLNQFGAQISGFIIIEDAPVALVGASDAQAILREQGIPVDIWHYPDDVTARFNALADWQINPDPAMCTLDSIKHRLKHTTYAFARQMADKVPAPGPR